jgi:voltage-gated potassium channel
MPSTVIGKTLAESRIREKTGCNVVALKSKENLLVSPDPMTPLLIDTELILVGTDEAEKRFLAFCQS